MKSENNPRNLKRVEIKKLEALKAALQDNRHREHDTIS